MEIKCCWDLKTRAADGFGARTMAATPVMPATTAVEDLLKHFGTRYWVVQSRNLHGFGVCLTDELFIKMEYNRPPEDCNKSQLHDNRAAHKARAFTPSLRSILSFFQFFCFVLGSIRRRSCNVAFNTKTYMRVRHSAADAAHRKAR